ncbi:MAG: acyltransferase [Solirubrobacterales bacterium]|nr:acyltransferase [Solirubrobacterales bacterium]
MPTNRLTALDGTFLELEDADPCAHMHIGAILVFGPRTDRSTPSLQEIRQHLDNRLDALPRYRQRLAHPGPGSVGWERWVPDQHFDVARHVHEATLRAPGGWEELFEWAGDYFSARLERSLPLWQITAVDGLADGHWALVTKTHHCLVDGVGSVDAAALLLDGVAEALGVTAPLEDPSASPVGRLAPVLHRVQGALHLAARPRDLARRAEALGELLIRDELLPAPPSSLNGTIGARRAVRGIVVDLDEVRRIKDALGGTVNDVVLAGACAGLRALLLARDEEPPGQGLRAMIPMNVRRPGEQLGNHISSLFVDLPVAEGDARTRYEQICEASAAVKGSTQPLGTDTLLRLAGTAPPVVHRLLAQTLFAKRLFNVTVTNVAGPPVPLTALGFPLTTVWPLVPIAADHAVGLAIVSYAGSLMFGVCADRDSVPDVDILAAGIADGLIALQRLATSETRGALSAG